MPSQQIAQAAAPYIPSRDSMDRHDYGVTKSRKASSTGGGRAWSDEEEAYLIQTRLQKMPYNASEHREPSPGEHLPLSFSPGSSRSYSPPCNISGAPHGNHIQLPSIVGPGEVPRLPSILPKPTGMPLPPPVSTYASPATDAPVPMPAPFHRAASQHRTTPPLRLDCTGIPPAPTHTAAHVDLSRLHAIYSAHRASFWTTIASEYGPNVSPTVLEQAWKTGTCCSPSSITPITPISSPGNAEKEAQNQTQSKGQDKTRISSILGIDADPRTARDRDMVRRLEEERFGMMQIAH
ncbi:hypothetical protein MRS44_008933 [Fusarium solani]|uniref:uncharacterized protein n=1 Tax=Fusarium solani TaxID=169388 RepID=UPI0032C48B5F|nr:hypothetical protein MRS44_008933 [Fusarium solani]